MAEHLDTYVWDKPRPINLLMTGDIHASVYKAYILDFRPISMLSEIHFHIESAIPNMPIQNVKIYIHEGKGKINYKVFSVTELKVKSKFFWRNGGDITTVSHF